MFFYFHFSIKGCQSQNLRDIKTMTRSIIRKRENMVFQLRKWLSIAFTFARVSHLLKKGFATDIFPATWLTSFTNLIRQIELEMLLFVYTWKLIRYARHLQHYQMFPQAKIWYMSNECIIGKKKCFLPRKNPLFLAVNKVTNAFQSGRKISFPTSFPDISAIKLLSSEPS